MEDTLEVKQQYLRSAIIEEGYNPQDFSTYMGTIRGEENVDLACWSLADLQSVVESYKQKIQELQSQPPENPQNPEFPPQPQPEDPNSYPNQNPTAQSDTQILPEETPELQKEPESKPKEKVKNNDPNDPFADYEKIINCEKLIPNEISNRQDLNITISNPEKKKVGVFAIPYFQYTMTTNPVGFKVVRKVSDFTYLYEKLPLINPGVYNPILPHFEFGLKDDSAKKILYIQNYMNSLIEDNFFRTMPLVYEFLTLTQEEWEKKKFEKYNKIKQIQNYEKMPNLEGIIHIKIDKESDEEGLKIKDDITLKTDGYDKLNSAMDDLLANMEKLILSFKNVSAAFWDLEKRHLNQKILNKGFGRLSRLFKKWEEDYAVQKDFFKDEIKYFFKFMNKENNAFLKKYDEFKTARDDYKNKFEKMKKNPANVKKEDEFTLGNLKESYGFQLAYVNEEIERLHKKQCTRLVNQFMRYFDKKDIIVQNSTNFVNLLNTKELFKEFGEIGNNNGGIPEEGGNNVGNQWVNVQNEEALMKNDEGGQE